MDDVILKIEDLTVTYNTEDSTVHALNNVALDLSRGETLGLVGETGAGKTTLANSIMRLIPSPPGELKSGRILYEGVDILGLNDKQIREIRGGKISMIFQDPMSALNPVMTVGSQIQEAIQVHEKMSQKESWEKSLKMLTMVGISPDRASDYPHQFSGGMKQRVIIAIALACSPEILIADEPTTALDVTIQAQALEMMQELKEKYNTAIILITHDLGIVAQMCRNVAIIYAGEIVEYCSVNDIFKRTSHPYTEGLLGAIPKINSDVRRLQPIDGLMPDPTVLHTGCTFAERCKYADDRCRAEHPELREIRNGHKVRCHKPLDSEYKY